MCYDILDAEPHIVANSALPYCMEMVQNSPPPTSLSKHIVESNYSQTFRMVFLSFN